MDKTRKKAHIVGRSENEDERSQQGRKLIYAHFCRQCCGVSWLQITITLVRFRWARSGRRWAIKRRNHTSNWPKNTRKNTNRSIFWRRAWFSRNSLPPPWRSFKITRNCNMLHRKKRGQKKEWNWRVGSSNLLPTRHRSNHAQLHRMRREVQHRGGLPIW